MRGDAARKDKALTRTHSFLLPSPQRTRAHTQKQRKKKGGDRGGRRPKSQVAGRGKKRSGQRRPQPAEEKGKEGSSGRFARKASGSPASHPGKSSSLFFMQSLSLILIRWSFCSWFLVCLTGPLAWDRLFFSSAQARGSRVRRVLLFLRWGFWMVEVLLLV